MKLSELLSPIRTSVKEDLKRDAKIEILTDRASDAAADSLFVCIKGARADGHAFAGDAYRNGCRVFLTETPVDLPQDAIVLTVPDTRLALSLLSCAFYHNPSRVMQVVGVTGTKGKTTTALLLTEILNRAGIPTGYIGTNGIRYGNVSRPTANSTPGALTFQKALREMLAAGVRTAVVEVSSQGLLQSRVAGTKMDTVVFTNLFPDHIGPTEHPDFGNYMACKQKLFTDFDAECAVFCKDNSFFEDFLRVSTAKESLVCSARDTTADFQVSAISPYRIDEGIGISFTVSDREDAYRCRLPMIGEVNAMNALLAAAVAKTRFGVPFSVAGKALCHASVGGRSECIPLPGGALAVIDYAHNGGSLRQLLSTLRSYQPSRLLVLFGSVGERTKGRRAELGQVAAELADICFLTSDNPGKEDPMAIIDEIAAEMTGTRAKIYKIPDRADAIRQALSLLQKGDFLVLTGKGHETYQLIGDEKVPFSEKELLLSLMPTTI